jgi:hypothetical protein
LDDHRFDALSQAIARLTDHSPAAWDRAGKAPTRRLLLGGLAASVLTTLLGAEAEAKKKRKRKNKKRGKPGKAGTCSPACTGEKVCQDGSCVCPDDRSECGDRCCPSGQFCSAGQCTACVPDVAENICKGAVCGVKANSCGAETSCGACPGNHVCRGGVCVAGVDCPPGTRYCKGVCLDDGLCCDDDECPGEPRCIGGFCRCPEGRVECNGRCCGDREMCDGGRCKRAECDNQIPGVKYCGPYYYNCCPSGFSCCPRVPGMDNVCCFTEALICCPEPGGCCNRDD